jgi:hypothetical protein
MHITERLAIVKIEICLEMIRCLTCTVPVNL